MNVIEFKATLKAKRPPLNIHPLLTALWYDAKGDWNKAHLITQEILTPEASRVHAYLHRKEGDMFNAEYWHRHAGTNLPEVTIEEEWELLVEKMLSVQTANDI